MSEVMRGTFCEISCWAAFWSGLNFDERFEILQQPKREKMCGAEPALCTTTKLTCHKGTAATATHNKDQMTLKFPPAAPSGRRRGAVAWRRTIRQAVRLLVLFVLMLVYSAQYHVLVDHSSSSRDKQQNGGAHDGIRSMVQQTILHDQPRHHRHNDDSLSHFKLKKSNDDSDKQDATIQNAPTPAAETGVAAATAAAVATTTSAPAAPAAAATTTTAAAFAVNNRNFMTHPISADESNRLLQAVKARHAAVAAQTPTPLLRVAICHPTIFLDDPDTTSMFLSRFLSFVSYHRLLGFEHFFFWYEANMATLPLFATLQALPYVTLTEYHAPPGHDVPGKGYHGQRIVEELCLSDARFASNYDWALPMDADEFLWFAPINTTTTATASPDSLSRYPTLQEFLAPYQAQNYTYLSIGKFSYTTLHVDDRYLNNDDDNVIVSNIKNNNNNKHNNNNYFGLLQYPYTTGPYCNNGNGKPICARVRGRAKVLVNPKFHTHINIHGLRGHKEPGGTHLHSIDVAHFMEWKHLHSPPNATTRVLHYDQESFYVTKEEQVQTYRTIKASRKNKTGHVLVYHDGDNMAKWFDFLVQQLPPLSLAI
jgi:Glycosyltransferase family 92